MTRILALLFALSLAAGAAFGGPARLEGAVQTPLTLDADVLASLPQQTLEIAFQTSKGPESGRYTGVLLWDLLGKAGLVNAEGKNAVLRHSLMVTGSDGYAAALALGEFAPDFGAKAVLLATGAADGSVDPDHPRLIVPGDLHGGRSVRDVVSIEVR